MPSLGHWPTFEELMSEVPECSSDVIVVAISSSTCLGVFYFSEVIVNFQSESGGSACFCPLTSFLAVSSLSLWSLLLCIDVKGL